MKNVDHENAALRTFILFVQTARAVLKYADADLYRKARLSTIKLIVLRALASNNRVMTPSEIAEWTHTERHNVTTLVDRLKQDGLVRAKRNNRNKRFVNIRLTDKGREVLSRAMPVAKEVVDQVMLSTDESDVALLAKPLGVLRQNAHYGLEYLAKPSKPWWAFCLKTLSRFSSRAASHSDIDDITLLTISLATGMACMTTSRPLSVSLIFTNLLSLLLRSAMTSPSRFMRLTNAVILCRSVCVHSAILEGVMAPLLLASARSTINLIVERRVFLYK